MTELSKVLGIGRVSDNRRALLVALREEPSDEDIRSMHDHLRLWGNPLLAVAPELVEALQEMVDWWETDGGNMVAAIERGKAVLRKVRGET